LTPNPPIEMRFQCYEKGKVLKPLGTLRAETFIFIGRFPFLKAFIGFVKEPTLIGSDTPIIDPVQRKIRRRFYFCFVK
jgi:hypothetical protein